MDMSTVKKRVFAQETSCVKDADGYWRVTVTITEKISVDGENWREDSIVAESLDRNFERAHKTAMMSALTELQETVYAKGFDALSEGKDYLKEHGRSQDNTTPVS